MTTISTQICLSGQTLFIGEGIISEIYNLLKDNVRSIQDPDDILTVCSDFTIADWDGLDCYTRSWFVATVLNMHDCMIHGIEEELLEAFGNEGIKLSFDPVANCYIAIEHADRLNEPAFHYFKRHR